MTTSPIVVLGAGLTGLSAACHLPADQTVVLEREAEVGGLCASRQVGGFVFDSTGHVLHLRDPAIQDLVQTLLPDTFARFERNSRIFSKRVYTAYPFQANTHGLPAAVVRECVLGFLEANRGQGQEPPAADFRQWLLRTFGEGIARHFMLPYNEKLYGVDLAELECDSAAWSIPRPTVEEVVRGSLGSEVRGLGYNPTFLYPRRGGIGVIARALAERCGEIRLGRTVGRIDLVAHRLELDGGETLDYEQLISTMPLDALLVAISPAPEPILREAAGRLRAVRVISFNFGVDREDVLPAHWVYFPEPEFPFYRVGSPTTYSESVAPRGCSSLCVEVARPRHAIVDREILRDQVLEALRAAGILRASDRILVEETRVLDPAYVLHDHYRLRALPRILDALAAHDVVSTGRYGAWEYGSMESALRQGRQAARMVLTPSTLARGEAR